MAAAVATAGGTMTPFQALRSVLFVPGNRPELIAKAEAAGADALVLDLEDSVAPAAKLAARHAVAAALAASSRLTFVRINRSDDSTLEHDLAVLAPHPHQAVMVPKVTAAGDLAGIDRRLTAFETQAGLPLQVISLMPVVECNMGLRNLYEIICSSPRVRGAGLASAEEGDLMADIGGQWTPTGEALAYARGKFISDARAARITWVLDGAFMNLDDHDALENECRLARIVGFRGKVAIHPRQVDIINKVFSPTEQEVERAHKLLRIFRKAEASGVGVTRFEGMMIDYANVKQAERVIALASGIEMTGKSKSIAD
jgi:citrate lyase subunit beta / citryl-CoA lyase